MKTERESFEEWIKNEDPFAGNDDNPDCIWAKKYMWNAWLASANRDGYKLVPVVANKKMLKAGYDAHNDFFFDSQVQEVYKAMIGAVNE